MLEYEALKRKENDLKQQLKSSNDLKQNILNYVKGLEALSEENKLKIDAPILDLLEDYLSSLKPIITDVPKYDYITAEFDTDLSNSVFYNRVPELTEIKRKTTLQGYALDFYKFHSKNWDDVERQIRDGQRTINQYVK
jgi:DNA polymerase III delta prime subunit